MRGDHDALELQLQDHIKICQSNRNWGIGLIVSITLVVGATYLDMSDKVSAIEARQMLVLKTIDELRATDVNLAKTREEILLRLNEIEYTIGRGVNNRGDGMGGP